MYCERVFQRRDKREWIRISEWHDVQVAPFMPLLSTHTMEMTISCSDADGSDNGDNNSHQVDVMWHTYPICDMQKTTLYAKQIYIVP